MNLEKIYKQADNQPPLLFKGKLLFNIALGIMVGSTESFTYYGYSAARVFTTVGKSAIMRYSKGNAICARDVAILNIADLNKEDSYYVQAELELLIKKHARTTGAFSQLSKIGEEVNKHIHEQFN